MNNSQNPNAKPRSGNRMLGGCLIAVAVVVLLIIGAGWWFVGRPITQVARSAQELTRIGSMDAQLDNRSPFNPPVDGELDRQRVDRYISVLESIRDDMQARFADLEQRYDQVGTERPTLSDIPRMAGAYADFIGLLGDARTAQINALNEQGFSQDEYAWTRRAVLNAAGMVGADYDLGNLLASLGGDGDVRTGTAPATDVPEANRTLVQEYRERLDGLGVLGMLGL